ncbi:MAG: hypothetical protein ACXVJD_14155, partial [Mucilaginibacter sp.]
AENYRTYLMSIGVLAGVMLLGGAFIVFVIPGPLDAGFQSVLFVGLMLISGTIFTSTVFNDIGNKRKAIPVLTLPASQFEKFLVGWIYSYPAFIVIFTSIFYAVLITLVGMKPWPHHRTEILTVFQSRMFIALVIYSLLHGVTLFGAVVFEKLHFVKTAFCFFIVYFILILLNTLFVKMLVGRDIMAAIPFGYLNFMEDNRYYSIDIAYQSASWVLVPIMILTFLFWAAAYFRLKEKQV